MRWYTEGIKLWISAAIHGANYTCSPASTEFARLDNSTLFQKKVDVEQLLDARPTYLTKNRRKKSRESRLFYCMQLFTDFTAWRAA
jgi:hypothetical protein